MNKAYRDYRRWIDGIEANIRQYLPGCNIELHELRKGFFRLFLERPLCPRCQCEHSLEAKVWKGVCSPQVINLTESQAEELEHASREEVEAFIKLFIPDLGPLGA